jgi:large subunit ribosomal protein L23
MSKTLDMREVLVSPLITEKSITATQSSQFSFRVHPEASKDQIRNAIEALFKVNVRRVNTVSMPGKVKTFARRGAKTTGKRSDWKKAIVVLDPGQQITLGGVNYFEQ